MWEDYPKPRPLFARGKWHVVVSIPRPLRIYYGIKGGGNNKRYVAGVNKSDYEAKKIKLSSKAYEEFDDLQRQIQEAPNKSQAFIDELWKQQNKIDADNRQSNFQDSVMMMISIFSKDVIPKGKEEIFWKDNDDKKFPLTKGTKVTKRFTSEMPYQDLKSVFDDLNGMASRVRRNPSRYEQNEIIACKRYLTPLVQSRLQDLLITTARKQNIEPPSFSKPVIDDFWHEDIDVEGFDEDHPDGIASLSLADSYDYDFDEDEIDQREVKTNTLSTFRETFMDRLTKSHDKIDTINRKRVGFDDFVRLMGDIDPMKIDEPMVYQWLTKLVDETPKMSKKTLGHRLMGMRAFSHFAVENRYMKSKPFHGIDLRGRGLASKKKLEYTDADLDKIFNYDWKEQERLLISLGLATGMRLGEIALLKWDQIIIGNRYNYIILIPSDEFADQEYYEKQIEVSVKNEKGKRVIPLHPSLQLTKPPNATGRVFNYSISGYKEATKSSGSKVNKILRKLVPHPRKGFHSLRSSLTIKLNQTGMGSRSKFITGHSMKGDIQAMHYDAMEVDERYEWISKMDLDRWLMPKQGTR